MPKQLLHSDKESHAYTHQSVKKKQREFQAKRLFEDPKPPSKLSMRNRPIKKFNWSVAHAQFGVG